MSGETSDRSAPAARNLELKVKTGTSELATIRDTLKSQGASALDRQDQEDVYFSAPDGRLKLRTIRTAAGSAWAELIGYRREDLAGSRWSSYRIMPMTMEQGPALVSVLAQALPIWVRVRKQREVFQIGATRVHLDAVEELGAFVELETVITNQAADHAEQEHDHVIHLLGLARYPVVAGSYSDLLAAKLRSFE